MLVAVGGPVRSSSVGAAFRSPMMMVGARGESWRYARLRVSRKSLVSSPNGTCVSSGGLSHDLFLDGFRSMHLLEPFIPSVAVQNPQRNATQKPLFLSIPSCSCHSLDRVIGLQQQNKNLGGFMPLIHVLWYLDKYLLDCGHADAVVFVDDTPPMAARIAMSDESGRTKVTFLGVSAIKQKDLANAV